jgi:hypothetical protein
MTQQLTPQSSKAYCHFRLPFFPPLITQSPEKAPKNNTNREINGMLGLQIIETDGKTTQ